MNNVTREFALKIFQQVKPDCVIIPPPDDVVMSMKNAGHETAICERLFDVHRFFSEIFFPNISSILDDTRDALLVYALNDIHLETLIKEQVCMPVAPDGKGLAKIARLFHPCGEVARSTLFTEKDGRFPHNSFAAPDVLLRMQHLGMQVDNVSWTDIVDRAQSVKQCDGCQ
jgi:hypothetical protein